MSRVARSSVLLVALVLAAAGCSDDDPDVAPVPGDVSAATSSATDPDPSTDPPSTGVSDSADGIEPAPPTADAAVVDAVVEDTVLGGSDASTGSSDPARTLVIDEPAVVADGDSEAGADTEDVARSVSVDELPEGFVPGVEPVGFGVVGVRLTSAEGDVCDVCLWLADDADERSQGLRGVTDLGEPVGMLFRWDRSTSSDFFMFETPTPLSIAWFDTDGVFVDAADMEPCIQDTSTGCIRYGASGDYRFAIEVIRGELDALGIGPGATLEVLGDGDLDCSVG